MDRMGAVDRQSAHRKWAGRLSSAMYTNTRGSWMDKQWERRRGWSTRARRRASDNRLIVCSCGAV
eukprot:9333805-Pyramimonas_sp.AAC.1